jgi:hypothetical protein
VTKDGILKPKNDHHNDSKDDTPTFMKQNISFWIDIQPGYLDKFKVEEEITKAFQTWSDVFKNLNFN